MKLLGWNLDCNNNVLKAQLKARELDKVSATSHD